MEKPELAFADKNGNLYQIYKNKLVYQPVRSAQSSSGMYDGGEAFVKPLKDADYKLIVQLFEAAAKNKTAQIQNRVKGSGVFVFHKGKKARTYILKQDSTEILSLEEVFQRIKTQE